MIDSIREDKPSYVKFERRAVEDKKASEEAGHYVAKDVDYVGITPSGGSDIWWSKVSAWWPLLDQQLRDNRVKREWVDGYKKAYEMWKNGQELPLVGTPIRGWGVISPALQETLIRMSVMTVEDLVALNDEGVKRIGMGGHELKVKARAWVAQLNDKGPLTQQMAAISTENGILKSSIESLQKQVENLMAAVKNQHQDAPAPYVVDEDILGSPREQYEAKFGKPPHHKMKEETILAALKG